MTEAERGGSFARLVAVARRVHGEAAVLRQALAQQHRSGDGDGDGSGGKAKAVDPLEVPSQFRCPISQARAAHHQHRAIAASAEAGQPGVALEGRVRQHHARLLGLRQQRIPVGVLVGGAASL